VASPGPATPAHRTSPRDGRSWTHLPGRLPTKVNAADDVPVPAPQERAIRQRDVLTGGSGGTTDPADSFHGCGRQDSQFALFMIDIAATTAPACDA